MKTSFLFIFLALVSSNLWAKKIQIIHINDLHSYFAEHQDGRGGYSKVKTVIDKLKSDAKENGIESIILDAGDWGEGNSYFLSNEGANSYRALGLLGVDVTIMGNHDHMMGGAILANQINKANVKTKILSANLIQTPQMNLKDIMKPTAVLEVDGLKIHIIGLSTAEPHHQGALFPGLIVPPETVMPLHAKRAKNAGADLIVALTHIGKGYDKRLAKLSKNIDVIVGGHSHDRIEEVIYQKSKSGIQVPIVQTGSFGVAVGSLIIDVKGPGKSSVVSYKLHDVTPTIEKEPIVQNFVQNAFDERNELFDGRWDEIIGTSEITIAGYQNGKSPKKASCWGEHMAEITRVGGKTDIGLYMANFTGTEFPAGNITLGMMVDNFPHFRNYGDMGWEISRFRLKGKKLKLLLRAV
ncbi:MAG: 5'-nucleotidase/UDP-sugar diphosphatase, partial [Thermoproteota archaeon]